MFGSRSKGATAVITAVFTSLGLCITATGSAWSKSTNDVFKGKQIELIVGYGAGGGYDTYARVVARYLSVYIPGHPTVVVQNMPGADGLKVANYMYSQAAKDGTVIALTNRSLVSAPMLGLIDTSSLQYDPKKFFWLANLNSDVSVAVFRSDSGVRSITNLRKKQYVVGATGLTSDDAIYPYVMNNVLHTKLKVVTGYPGTNALTLALERHEIQGIGGWAWSSIMVQRPQWIADKTIIPVLQLSTRKLPELPHTPSIMEYVKGAKARQALELIFFPDTLGRPFFAPPGVPSKVGQILRMAFTKLASSAKFLAAAKKARLQITFTNGQSLNGLIQRISNASPAVVTLAKKMIERGETKVGTKAR